MTVIVTKGGERLPVGAKSSPIAGSYPPASRRFDYSGDGGIELIGYSGASSYASLYRDQHWVRVAVDKLARGVARLPLLGYGHGDEATNDRERLGRDHELSRLLKRPYPRGSRFRLVESIVGHVAIYNSALVAKYRPGPGRPVEELWPVPWRIVSPITGDDGMILAYEVRGPAGASKFLLAEDCIHFRYFDGVSPLRSLARTLALEDAAQRYGIASFANAARPSGAFVSAQALRPEKKTELQAQLAGAWSGIDNSFKTLLLDAGLDYKTFGGSATDAQTIEHRKLNREEVCAAFDIPPPILHILDRATFSNIDEQHRMWYQDTLGPWLTMIEDTIEAELLEGELAFADTFVEFNLNEVLRGDPQKRAEAYSKFLTSGTYTINELRRLENLPRIEHPLADAVFVPLNYQPVAEGLDAEAEPSLASRTLELVGAMVGLGKADADGTGKSDRDPHAVLRELVEGAGLKAVATRVDEVARDVIELKARPLELGKGDPAPPVVILPEGVGTALADALKDGLPTIEVAAAPAPDVHVNVPERKVRRVVPVRDPETGRAIHYELEED